VFIPLQKHRDGKCDLLWRNVANGDLVVQYMNGLSPLDFTFVKTTAMSWQLVGASDLQPDEVDLAAHASP